MELAVWPDFEDHLQTTAFTSCIGVSDAKDDTSGGHIVMPLLGRKERTDHMNKIYIRHGLYHSSYLYIIHSGSDYPRWAEKAKI